MKRKYSLVVFLTLASIFIITQNSFAHCDSVEGPVVAAAKNSLESGNLNLVLIWVNADDEEEIRNMFNKVNKVRNINEDVRELADMYFFETLVRIHRMGEGVGYTGLKFEDFNPAKGIDEADKAIEEGSADKILQHLDESQHSKVIDYFTELQSKKNYDINDVVSGREYVASYVHFIHYVEALFDGSEVHEKHNVHKHVH